MTTTACAFSMTSSRISPTYGLAPFDLACLRAWSHSKGVQPERPEKIEHTLSQGLIASVDDEHRLALRFPHCLLDLRCPPRRLSKPALPIGLCHSHSNVR